MLPEEEPGQDTSTGHGQDGDRGLGVGEVGGKQPVLRKSSGGWSLRAWLLSAVVFEGLGWLLLLQISGSTVVQCCGLGGLLSPLQVSDGVAAQSCGLMGAEACWSFFQALGGLLADIGLQISEGMRS